MLIGGDDHEFLNKEYTLNITSNTHSRNYGITEIINTLVK